MRTCIYTILVSLGKITAITGLAMGSHIKHIPQDANDTRLNCYGHETYGIITVEHSRAKYPPRSAEIYDVKASDEKIKYTSH